MRGRVDRDAGQTAITSVTDAAGLAAVRRVVWLLPAAFIVHDGEELWTMAGWIRAHESLLHRVAETGALPRLAVANLPTTTRQVGVAILVVLFVLVAAIGALWRRPERRGALFLYAALLGAFAAHSLSHVGLTMALHEYTPGVVTAIVVIPPSGLAVYRRLFRSTLLTPKSALLTAAAGLTLVFPFLLAAHFIGRLVAR